MRDILRIAALAAFFPFLLASATEDKAALKRCMEMRPTPSSTSKYSPLYAICLASIGKNELAVREFKKKYSAPTTITDDNVVEVSMFSGVLAKTAGLQSARPWWRRIVALYYPIDLSILRKGDTYDDYYATVLALHGQFRAALSAYAAFARVNIVGMSEDSFFDDDRTISDRIVQALDEGSEGHFELCYLKLRDLTADKWMQQRPLFAGVCAQAAGDSVQAQRSWLICLQKYGGYTSERLTVGGCALQSMRLLLTYAN